MPYFIAAPCIDVMDKSCVDECPVDCIYEGDRKLYINPQECISCGACEPACPQVAIFVDFKAPSELADFAEDNERFFAEPLAGRAEPVGDPGGSGLTGRVGVDTPLVRSWEPPEPAPARPRPLDSM